MPRPMFPASISATTTKSLYFARRLQPQPQERLRHRVQPLVQQDRCPARHSRRRQLLLLRIHTSSSPKTNKEPASTSRRCAVSLKRLAYSSLQPYGRASSISYGLIRRFRGYSESSSRCLRFSSSTCF